MSTLLGCHDARNMTSIQEIACPSCGYDIEVFVKDGVSVGDSVCEKCGYKVSEGSHLEQGRLIKG